MRPTGPPSTGAPRAGACRLPEAGAGPGVLSRGSVTAVAPVPLVAGPPGPGSPPGESLGPSSGTRRTPPVGPAEPSAPDAAGPPAAPMAT